MRRCEHGYNVAFGKTTKDLATYFHSPAAAAPQAVEEIIPEPDVAPESASTSNTASLSEGKGADVYQASNTAAVLASIPVTLDDNVTKELLVHDGQSAEEAVVSFCRSNVADEEVAPCIRQLLSVVIDKLASLDIRA